MKKVVILALSLVLMLLVGYIYAPLSLPSSEAQPAVPVEQPAVDEAEVKPLVVPTLAVKESAFSEKQLEKFDWSKVGSSTLSDISYG